MDLEAHACCRKCLENHFNRQGEAEPIKLRFSGHKVQQEKYELQ